MHDRVSKHASHIATLCRQNGVQALWVFGSACRDDFDPARSDFDFLVDFGQSHPHPAQQFHDLRLGLERLFGQRIDIVSLRALRNPILKSEIELTRESIYVAA